MWNLFSTPRLQYHNSNRSRSLPFDNPNKKFLSNQVYNHYSGIFLGFYIFWFWFPNNHLLISKWMAISTFAFGSRTISLMFTWAHLDSLMLTEAYWGSLEHLMGLTELALAIMDHLAFLVLINADWISLSPKRTHI